jgi:DNA helicase-2/ATP-dependent DNA helicase PcrA
MPLNAMLEEELAKLSSIQRTAVDWTSGPLLVLAGPGAGKTKVLTVRTAKLLAESPGKRFKVLALTFTTKAAAEMRDRVAQLVPDEVEARTTISTFHAFCTQILRQHGSHLGIEPDFGIYDREEDRSALLSDALSDAIQAGREFSMEDLRWLRAIEEMKRRLLRPENVGKHIADLHMPEVYKLYEEKLRSENALDFNGLILETCRLLATLPAVAQRIRTSYPFWLIDEFQDTSRAQYWLLHYLSGGVFRNVFAVADDDQIIYQWAGASYRQIERFRADYIPTLIQLAENHRCPPEIVVIANRLVANNTLRAPEKVETVPARSMPLGAIRLRSLSTDVEEREVLAEEIRSRGDHIWGKIAILGRTRSLLEPMLAALRGKGVNAALLRRRDKFISPQFVWLHACLDQALHPMNRAVFRLLVDAANRFAQLELDPLILSAEAEAAGRSLFEHWTRMAAASNAVLGQKLGSLADQLVQSRNNWRGVIDAAIPLLLASEAQVEGAIGDAVDDYAAWQACMREIRAEVGSELDLPALLQGLALRSKEPPRDPNAVALLTIHTSKGLEFDYVYVIGLAEGEMPSWQSLKKGDTSPEMEEERRNCFVAITRTREGLILSRADQYRGYVKRPSRFLEEMSIIGE